MIRAGDYERDAGSGLMLPRRRGILREKPTYMSGPMFFNPLGGVPNYTNWNPSDKASNCTLSGGNLSASFTTTSSGLVRSAIGKSSGKWYWEVTLTAGFGGVGITTSAAGVGTNLSSGAASYSYFNNVAQKFNNGTGVAYGGTAYAAVAVIGVMLNMTDGEISFIKGGTNQGVAYTGLSGTFFAAVGLAGISAPNSWTANFGASAFSNSVPSGFNAGLY